MYLVIFRIPTVELRETAGFAKYMRFACWRSHQRLSVRSFFSFSKAIYVPNSRLEMLLETIATGLF